MAAKPSLCSANSCEPRCRAPDVVVSDQFPAGLRVLVVDDDITCLKILDQKLRRCKYEVTSCSESTAALKLLREKKGCFDLVLSDVHMPDMDGFKLLELVGLEMDLPVIMMSADGRISTALRGVRHGACYYLMKPIFEEQLKNIWQHVVRKRWNGNKEYEHSGSLDENDRQKRGGDDAEYASSVNEGSEGILKTHKKRRDVKGEDDCELENDDPAAPKKPRVVWSVELHQQFVSAVNQLGIDKAVPKRILELMNVPGLTRENVASHLQFIMRKFRLYLRRLSGVAQQQGGIANPICGRAEQNPKLGSLGRFDIQALAASGQIPPQTFAALHAELLGQPTNNLVLPTMDQQTLLQASLQGPMCIPVDQGVAYGQPLTKCPSNISQHFSQPIISTEDGRSGLGAWPSNNLGIVGPSSNLGGLAAQTGNMLMGMMQNPQQQQSLQQHRQSVLPEPSRSINVQSSCLVVPLQLSSSFQTGNSPASVNQNGSFNTSVIDYSLLLPESNNSARQISHGDLRTTGVVTGYSAPGSISPSVSSCSVQVDKDGWQVQSSAPTFSAGRQLRGLLPNVSDNQGCYGADSNQVFDQGPPRNLGLVGKGAPIPSRFAVDEPEQLVNNLIHQKICADNNERKVKQEPSMEFIGNAKTSIPLLQHFSP